MLCQELIDLIIDHLADSGQHCPIVSRSFRRRSQQNRFESIVIKGDTQNRVQNLFTIIQHNPDIARYIQELTLECTGFTYSWIGEDPLFIAIMDKISTSGTPIRKLTIRADADENDGYETLMLKDPKPLLDHFFLPFISPFITSLTLERLENVPIEVVESCVHLTHLELLHVRWAEGERRNSSQSHHRLKLRHLAHRLSRPELKKLFNPSSSSSSSSSLDLSHLKSFIVYTDELRDLEFENQIIDISRESLEEIYIISMQNSWSGMFHGVANLHESPCLRLLHAHVLFPEDSLVSICQTLSTIRTRSLENLLIDAKVAFCDFYDPEVVFNADWPTFCSQVARVMSTEGGFEFKMAYMYGHHDPAAVDLDLDTYRNDLDERCQSVITQLHTEIFSSLEEDTNPRFTIALSYDLEYDLFSE
ncbi:hypothetical protein BYT27DRAFT_7260356 [Phlegmacium glaucopus]|nr:hypothetical protein BYT27DRAFT_7260356 [Phlegmacium glaucopus]